MERSPKPLFRRGAESGIIMGVYFILLCGVMVSSDNNALLSLLSLLLIAGTPFLAYRLMRRSFVALHGMTTYSALWLEGILMFIGGSILLALAAYIFFRFLSPTFIADRLVEVAAYYNGSSSQSMREIGGVIDQMIETHSLPRPIDMAFALAWLGAASGSLVSLLLAAIARRPIR